MQALTNRVKPVDRRKMNFWERMYLPEIFKGMSITFRHIFKKKLLSIILKKQGLSVRYFGVCIF